MKIEEVMNWAIKIKGFKKEREDAFYYDLKNRCEIIITAESSLIIDGNIYDLEAEKIYLIVKNLIEDK